MCYFDKYDIIVENSLKELQIMQTTKEKSGIISVTDVFETPQYSKKQITKAGKILTFSKDVPLKEANHALDVLNNWRSSHAYPLQVIARKLRRDNPNAIVVQRLKRLDSILGKLQRFPEMDLYRMQDLGGCRVIVDTVPDVYISVNKYKNSHVRHILKREYDYIQNPKESGYRSYHMVYQFQSDVVDTYNKNMMIEIQFRTKLQHVWATAIEMMGVYTKTALKSSIGDGDVLRFFALVSSVFALKENLPVVPNTSDNYDELVTEIKQIDKNLNIISKLSALSVAIKYINEKELDKRMGYYILLLNYENKMLRVYSFPHQKLEAATMAYNKIEANNDENVDAVLVAANSLDTVKDAYPNYFVDISEFVGIMREITK